MVHNSETLQRISDAREHYKTRGSHRLKGKSRRDGILYDAMGFRRPTAHSTRLIELIRRDGQLCVIGVAPWEGDAILWGGGMRLVLENRWSK